MKVHARKRKMEARRAALEAGERLAEMAGVEPSNTNTNTSEETGEGSPNDSSKNRSFTLRGTGIVKGTGLARNSGSWFLSLSWTTVNISA